MGQIAVEFHDAVPVLIACLYAEVALLYFELSEGSLPKQLAVIKKQ